MPAFAQQTITNPVITLTAQGAGTVNSAALPNLYGRPVICVFNQASHTLSPSTTFSIQDENPGLAGSWVTLVTSSAIVADATPTALAAGAGVQAAANISSSLPVTPAFRVQVVATAGTITGTVGCSVN